jgi:hypothetical protein
VSDASRHRPRYAPSRALPARAFIPGVSPADHRPDDTTRRRDVLPADLAADEAFRFGVDLFNHGFPWEAHEVWESLWHAAPHHSRERLLLQGLIHAAAAAVKARGAQWVGARKLAQSAAELLEGAGRLAGIHGEALATALGVWRDHAEHGAAPPPIVLAP